MYAFRAPSDQSHGGASNRGFCQPQRPAARQVNRCTWIPRALPHYPGDAAQRANALGHRPIGSLVLDPMSSRKCPFPSLVPPERPVPPLSRGGLLVIRGSVAAQRGSQIPTDSL
jgi:hypothetical protein